MKMKSCKLIFVGFLLLSILSIALPAFSDDSALQVKCVDSDEKPIPNVKVVAFNLNSDKAKDKKSNSQGDAEFTKLDDGVYRIFGRKEGFAPALYEYAILKESTESITLKFAAGADRTFYFEDPAENQKAIGLQTQGLEAYKKSNFTDAEKLFAQSLEITPASADTLYYYALSFMQQGKFEQGSEILKKTEKIAGALKTVPASLASDQGRLEQIYQNAVLFQKRMHALQGEFFLKQKKYEEAIVQFSEAVKSDPGNPEYHANLAIALTNAKKFDEAIAAIEKAIQLKPDEKGYTTLKGSISARKENAQIEKAQAILDEGKKLLQDGDASAAIRKFEEAKVLVSQDKQSPIWSQIARAQAKLDQHDAAVASFKKAIELAPADKIEEFRNALAQYYLDGKKYDEAIDVLADPQTAGSKSPEEVLLELVKASRNRDPKLAEAALERIIKANPENFDAYYELGRLYFTDGKEKDSRTQELLTKFVEMGKDQAKIEDAKGLLIVISRRKK